MAFYKGRDYESALTLFASIAAREGAYRKTHFYIDKCALRLGETRRAARVDEAVRRAEDLVAARRALLEGVLHASPGARVEADGPRTLFHLRGGDLFPADGLSFHDQGEALLALLKDYVGTFQNPYVTVVHQRGPTSPESDARRDVRRAVSAALYFFRRCGLSADHVAVLSRPAEAEGFRLEVDASRAPDPDPLERVQGVMVSPRAPSLDLDAGVPLPLDVTLLDPRRIRGWTLRVLAQEEGVIVRTFSGTSDLFVSLSWDGRDDAGRLVEPGEYELFLEALNYASERVTDSAGIVVTRASPKAPPTPVPPRPAPAPRRKWMHVVRFDKDQSGLSALNKAELRRVADNIRAFPGVGVSVNGFADAAERDARRLAEDRARRVASELVSDYGILPSRIAAQGRDPRAPAPGETLRKAVIFFVEP